MRRGGPLTRRTPLQAGSARLARGTGLPRGGPIRPKAKTREARQVVEDARAATFARAKHRCEYPACPFPASDWHHRKLRSRGGLDCPCNTVALCSFHHHDRVHGQPTTATEDGWMVPTWADPLEVPVNMGRRWYLGCDGKLHARPTGQPCILLEDVGRPG